MLAPGSSNPFQEQLCSRGLAPLKAGVGVPVAVVAEKQNLAIHSASFQFLTTTSISSFSFLLLLLDYFCDESGDSSSSQNISFLLLLLLLFLLHLQRPLLLFSCCFGGDVSSSSFFFFSSSSSSERKSTLKPVVAFIHSIPFRSLGVAVAFRLSFVLNI